METTKNCLINTNRRLLPIKLHYFFFFAAIGFVIPFRTIFCKQLGISATEVGVIFSIAPFLKVLSNPALGFIIDHFKKIRLTVSVIMITVAISHTAMIFIPSDATHTSLDFTENDFYTKVKYSCYNEEFPDVRHHKLLVFNAYTTKNDSEGNTSSFSCDIQCSDSVSKTEVSVTKNASRCNQGIKCEFSVFANITNYNMDICIERSELIITTDTAKKVMHVNLNNSTSRKLTSWISFPSNISEKVMSSLTATTRNNRENNELNRMNDIFGKGINYPLDSDSNSEIYSVLHEYLISAPADNFKNDNSCSVNFNCETIRCVSRYNQGDESLVKESEFISIQFWSMFVLIAVSGVSLNAVIFIMDAVCYELLQDRKDRYGQQRLYGTIGWGVGCLLGGFFNKIVSTDSGDVDYTISFCMIAVFIAIDLLPIYHLKVDNLNYSPNIFKDVCFLLSKLYFVYNLITVFIIGLLSGFIWNYQFWFMKEIGSGQILLGLSQIFECAFEIPCFILSGWIIKKIGHDHCNSITFLFFGLRYLCFVFMHNPWWTLAVAFFHGPTYGLFFASLTMYAKDNAPPGTEATVQSLLQLTFEGLGVGTGTVLGGIGLDYFGSRRSFMYSAALSFLMLFINFFKIIVFSRGNTTSKPS